MLFNKAKKYLVGGVNSPVRAFKAVGGKPVFIARGKGSKIFDVQGKQYVDLVGSWGPLILGHTHPAIVAAAKKALDNGTSFGACTELEIELAELIISAFPSIELVRLVNSGSEATMSAIRLARGYTGRDKIIKFAGCYHGHVDSLLVEAGSGVATLGIPGSPGVPKGLAKETIVLPFNDLVAVEKTLKLRGKKIAALIVEPIPGNMGVVLPQKGFLQGLRKLTRQYGVVLIFDEVISGFRVAYGGAQELLNIKADLTCLGKIIGGGLPVGAFGGKKEIMRCLAPEGNVYQAGTLAGNPLAMATGIATLKILRKNGVYQILEHSGKQLADGLRGAASQSGGGVKINRQGSMFTLFFTDQLVVDFKSAQSSDTNQFKKYFHKMLRQGVYLPPSQFEANFLSLAHSQKDLNKIIAAAGRALI